MGGMGQLCVSSHNIHHQNVCIAQSVGTWLGNRRVVAVEGPVHFLGTADVAPTAMCVK